MPNRRAFSAFLRQGGVEVGYDEPLAPATTFRCGGSARYFIRPRDPEELSKILSRAKECEIDVRVLGGGANVLVRDGGIDGAVLRLNHWRRCAFQGERVRVEAGYGLPGLVKEAVSLGLSGLEGLAGVPGSVGGSLAMNAGGIHGEIGQRVRALDVMEPDGTARRLRREDVEFHYRGTSLEDRIILGCALHLYAAELVRVVERYAEILSRKKASQPLGARSAGCVFRNPPGDRAGRLIDECGLKGESVGDARVSRKHANFIVNGGACTASDVLKLVDRVRDRVKKRFDIDLELEILVW
ncbi:MAG: UDP-N-acetylmuramate dehydrogenase [Planctomycetota bacterium]|jgi:UDP-N-acetylmuramate dehydrogenase